MDSLDGSAELRSVNVNGSLQRQAHLAVNRALRSGRLKKPKWCQQCKQERQLNAHHPNGYEPPHELDVTWLCNVCHGTIHCAKGYVHSPETREKIASKLRGRKLSPETRAKMSAARQRDRELIAEKSRRAWAEGRGHNQHV